MNEPVALRRADGWRVLLKWHVLRRQPADVPFNLDNLRAGISAGASVEIDIQTTVDDDWVVLHDDTLDDETTGSGPVVGQRAADIRHQFMRDPTSGSPAQPVAFLDDVTAIVAENDFGDGFVLQLDLKARKPSSRSIERFTELIAPIASHCILSGADWHDVRKLSRSIDGLRLGYDPIDMLVAALPGVLETPESTIAFAKSALTVAPEADWIYLYHKLVTAALDAGVDLIAEAHALGQKVDVWTIDPDDAAAPKSVERLVELGVDQITTNAAVDWLKWWAAR